MLLTLRSNPSDLQSYALLNALSWIKAPIEPESELLLERVLRDHLAHGNSDVREAAIEAATKWRPRWLTH
jgi:hypothetical protein